MTIDKELSITIPEEPTSPSNETVIRMGSDHIVTISDKFGDSIVLTFEQLLRVVSELSREFPPNQLPSLTNLRRLEGK